MRIQPDTLTGLLSKPITVSKANLPVPRRAKCGRAIARQNELRTLQAVAQFGHLRPAEISRAVWPKAKYGEQLARRTLRRLIESGHVAQRRNALGTQSVCITRVGAAKLTAHGINAQHTLDLSSVAGATFIHRTLASRHLIERQLLGLQVAGEYRILRKDLPFTIEKVSKVLRKLPDGLVWQTRSDGRPIPVEFIEQEAAPKSREELERCLKVAEFVGTPLPGDKNFVLGGLVFVFDRSLNHAQSILRAATSLWNGRSAAERAGLESRVKLVFVELGEPIRWLSSTEMTLNEFRQRKPLK